MVRRRKTTCCSECHGMEKPCSVNPCTLVPLILAHAHFRYYGSALTLNQNKNNVKLVLAMISKTPRLYEPHLNLEGDLNTSWVTKVSQFWVL